MPIYSFVQNKTILFCVIVLLASMMVACNFSSMTPVESAQSGANAVSTQVAQTVEAQVIATQIAARNTAVAGMPDTVTAEPGVVETQIAMTVAAQGNEANAELAATTAALVAVERQMERTAVALASTQTANNYIQQTRNAQEALALQQANATPAVRAILDSVNVRSGPGTEYRVISNLRNNDIVPVVAKSGDGEWFIVEMPGGFRGWVHDSVTDPVLAQAMAKVGFAATIPPPPTFTPTPTNTPTPVPVNTEGWVYVNNVGEDDICYLYISPSSSDSWGNDRLGSSVLYSGSAINIVVDFGWYDLKAEGCDGNLITELEVYVPQGGSYSWTVAIDLFAPAGTTLTIENWLDDTVCYLYISPSTSSGWGNDWLGDDVLDPYESMTLSLNPDTYDMKITDCAGNEIEVLWDIYLSGESYWMLE